MSEKPAVIWISMNEGSEGSVDRAVHFEQGRAAAGGLWVERDHDVYSVISSSRNASSNSHRTPRVLSPGEEIKRVKAMRVDCGAGVELATGDIDVSKCGINDGSWCNANHRAYTATVNVATWYR